MKMLCQKTEPVVSHGFLLRSVLLLVLLLGVGAGATAYVLGNAIAAVAGTPTTSHNYTLTSS
jgi:hypothetical protein